MIIIETCPVCGHDLVNITLATNPPIPGKECWNCGWSWQGTVDQVVRVPFSGNSYLPNLNDYTIRNVTLQPSDIQS